MAVAAALYRGIVAPRAELPWCATGRNRGDRMSARHVLIRGRVQGVGYRAFVQEQARRLDLEGWVRNLRDGAVEAVFAGTEEAVAAAVSACHRGPPGARVDTVEVQEAEQGSPPLLRRRRPGERFSVLPTGS